MITERQRSRRRASLSGEPLYSGIGGSPPHGRVAHLPLRLLGELVVAQHAVVAAGVAFLLGREVLGLRHEPKANLSPWRR